MLDKVSQVMILVLGITVAFVLSMDINTGIMLYDIPIQRYGYVLGLCSQPFWIYTTWKNKQYPLLVLSTYYTFTWIWGIYNNFI